MRAIRPAIVALMAIGCAGAGDRVGARRGQEADAAVAQDAAATPEDDAALDNVTVDGRPEIDAPVVGRDAGRPDVAVGPPADVAADLARDVATDLARDVASPRDGAADLARDVAPANADVARDTSPADRPAVSIDAPAVGAPEPGRLAGITRFHNQVRAGIPVPELVWDPGIAATAAAYAARCIFEHSDSDLGENLAAYAPPGNQTASGPVSDWADEAKDYNYASNTCTSEPCGHYTQLVWKSSRRLGCAVQVCTENSPFTNVPRWEIWVCNYSPPGNIVGQRPY
jgi:pathogenesis-related protein 1